MQKAGNTIFSSTTEKLSLNRSAFFVYSPFSAIPAAAGFFFGESTMAMLCVKEVASKTGLSRTTIYSYVAEEKSDFPLPVKLGKKKVRWLSEEVDAWLQSRIDARGSKE